MRSNSANQMSLTADQARVIADYTLSDYEHERAPTKRVIGAVPAGQESYAPSAKCMTSLDLAWHLASSELFFHRGQLSSYLRPMGAAVPGIYGPSGDTQ